MPGGKTLETKKSPSLVNSDPRVSAVLSFMKQRFQLPGSLSCGRGPWAIPGGRLVVLPRGQSRCPDFKWSTEHKHNWPHGTPTHRESAVKQTLSFCKFISLRHQGFGGQTGEVSLFHPFSSSGLQQQNFGPW